MTTLLEYLDLLAVFPEVYVPVLTSISIFAMQNRLSYSSQKPIFKNFTNFSRNLLLASYFSKKFAGKIGFAVLTVCTKTSKL